MTPLFIDNNIELLGIPVFSTEGISTLIFRFIFNLVISLIIIRYIYYPKTKRRDFLFTFLLIGQIIFLMCFLLESVKLQIGFALGYLPFLE
jgi:tellurite resistance protein TehA-like permease